MFGSWLATENELVNGPPSKAMSSTNRKNPVMREIRVAKAIPHDRDTTAASDNSARPARRIGPVACGILGGPGGRTAGWSGEAIRAGPDSSPEPAGKRGRQMHRCCR
ncbi:hypothetical protein MALV_35260 [Mycolicibacterium alvei]|uniref:Uncharacterized protein n=1 Tax=Mycolicibacterium alvei TaxID=67081 RepID=A0A6N4UY59_9MYCO|nr:hypothetical protein MALV_35260 [Mycolicibacterium alvei]